MQFELHHFPIWQKNINSFNASIQQIQIIQPGEMQLQTAFKRQRMSEGPIEVAKSIPVPHVNTAPTKKKMCMLEAAKEGHDREEKGMFHIKWLDGDWWYIDINVHNGAGSHDKPRLKEGECVEKGMSDIQKVVTIQRTCS